MDPGPETNQSIAVGRKRAFDDSSSENPSDSAKKVTPNEEPGSIGSDGAIGRDEKVGNSIAEVSPVAFLPVDVEVVSYNVLSSHLASPDHFKSNDPKYLKADYRFEKLKTKLQAKIDTGSVICLQEVSMPWASKLHTYFVSKGYYFISCHYGKKFNGIMGVAIAIPLHKYEILDVEIPTVSYTKWLPRAQAPGFMDKVSSAVLGALKYVKLYTPPRENPWVEALWRNNQMIMVRLRPQSTSSLDGNVKEVQQKSFVVGTYHMPCMFQVPQVMVIHSALSAQCIEKFAKDDPYMYVGDFNIKPDSSMYTLLTTGSLEETHPDFPHNVPGDTYELKTRPLRSAYKEADGAEPNFTNYAKPGNAETFIDTLDYIFLSDHWKVTYVDPLPHRDQVEGPLPTKDEPSDHLLIAARLSC
jgi:mRNA deadenylase 3'-5' endonuclease subunit Ccr4